MDQIYTDILSVWGAVVATILAGIRIIEAYRNRPSIKVTANLAFRPVNKSEEIKGTRVFNEEHQFHQEVLLQVTAANHGNKPLQITGIVLEEEVTGYITQVRPNELPAVLDPKTAIDVKIQKEWIDRSETSLLGVIDALGERHTISNRELKTLMCTLNLLCVHSLGTRLSSL